MQKRISKSYGYDFAQTLTDYFNRYIKRMDKTGDGGKYIKFGNDNRLPQELIELIGSNGAATRAMRLRSKYLYANGFETSFAYQVNEKQNANQLLQRVVIDVAIFQGFALQVIRSANGQVAAVYNIPFEWVRKDPNGGFVVNKTLGTTSEKEDWEQYPKYKGRVISVAELAEQKKQYGNKAEIAYFYIQDPLSFDYPIPDYFSGEFDIRTATELMLLDNEMVTNGFMPSAILTMVGETDDEQEDEDGMTAADHRDNLLRQFTGNKRDANTGKSSRMRLLVLEAPNRESVPDLQTFDVEKIVSGSIEKRDDINRQVCRLFGMHPVLLGYSEATVLGNQQALANASMEAANNVLSDQQMIQEAFEDLFEGDFSITKFTPISYIPDSILTTLTEDEKREMIGYEPIERAMPSESEKILNTLNSLSPLLAAEIVRNMPKEDLLKLVGITVKEEIVPDGSTD